MLKLNLNPKTISIHHKQPSLNSLSSLDDDLPSFQTIPSLHQEISNTPDQFANNPLVIATTSELDMIEVPSTPFRPKKSLSAIPSYTCLDDIYDRINKYLDEEGLHITQKSPTGQSSKRQLTLKPCMDLESVSSLNGRLRANTEEHIKDNSLLDKDLGKVAMPSFLMKRAGIQRSMSGTFPLANVVPKKSWNLSAEAQKSTLEKFSFSEMPNQEGEDDIAV